METEVLFGVEHFEEGGCRVALVVIADFVNLVEHEHRIGGAGAAYRLDDASGHGADICAAVTAYLGLVMQPAERYALEFASERVGYRLPERCLADSRRAYKA